MSPAGRRPPTRDSRDVETNVRQGAEGIALVVALTGLVALIGWLLAVVVAWVY